MGVLTTASFLIGLAINSMATRPLPLLASPDQFKEVVAEGAEAHKSEILDLWRSGEAIFIDARSEDQYAKGHVPGAISIPYKSFESGFPDAVEILPKDQQLVVYCDGADCHASQAVYDHLLELGFNKENMKIFSGGWTDWEAMGAEVEKGEPDAPH
jgi:rhodanese-related sulfurtransferase